MDRMDPLGPGASLGEGMLLDTLLQDLTAWEDGVTEQTFEQWCGAALTGALPGLRVAPPRMYAWRLMTVAGAADEPTPAGFMRRGCTIMPWLEAPPRRRRRSRPGPRQLPAAPALRPHPRLQAPRLGRF